MANKPLPTPEQFRQLLTYDPETGLLMWKPRPVEMFNTTKGRTAEQTCLLWNARDAFAQAFTSKMGQGYWQGTVLGCNLLAHRVIWAIMEGEWPDGQIDHINGDRADNRWGNLRLVSNQANSWNMLPRGGTSRFRGVYKSQGGKWRAAIKVDGKPRHLGSFSNEEDAARAYNKAAAKSYGDYARLNDVGAGSS